MRDYQEQFIEFLARSGALTFGDFVTKSGRQTPYFINTGRFDSGDKVMELGQFYAAHLMAQGLGDIDVLFGPAYKGIPLAVATAIGFSSKFKRDVGFVFDRKEGKDHGDGGLFVGTKLKDGQKLVIVEDVITAGTTLRNLLPILNKTAKLAIEGVVVAVDRCERGSGTKSAIQETEKEFRISIHPIVTIHHILAHLSQTSDNSLRLSPESVERVNNYLSKYGAA